MLLLAGLGNPGGRYAHHRHNIGFLAADAVYARHGFDPWRNRFNAYVAEGRMGSQKCLLMKPMTFMNNSGQAIGEAMRFYKLEPDDVVVIHDELDLPPGKLRVKSGGGVAGHNGLRSTAAHIGPDFRRVRIGIGHPGNKNLVHRYVLHDFAKDERDGIVPMLDAIADNAGLLASGEDSTFMNRVHLATAPLDDGPDDKAGN
jgi:peptidyl-tRNA hydrolase, PTH1 family